ncbi:MAG: fimbrillin family protein, partial [Prevotella sp.]|nr:fimbrillin family protein [Prevotella sp.]
MKKYNILSSLFVAAVFGGCVSDYEPNYTGALSDKEISFKVSTANPSNAQAIVGQGTRATDLQDGFLEPIKAVSDYQKPLYLHTLISSVPDTSKQASRAIQYTEATDINSFGVLAYRYASSASATTPNFLYNSEFQKVGSKWSSVNKYYWPVNSDKLDFYAYAPYNNSAITLSAEDASGVPTMEFTVNPDASLQADLITAKALTQDLSAANTGVPLEFTHNLTTVKFILGEDMLGTVTSITFKNIYTDGKLTFGGAWNFNGKTRGDISVPYNTNTYLIPQVFSDQAQEIQVVYNDGLQSYTLHYKLQGTSWTAGKAVTYCINSSAVTQLKLGAINFDASLSEKPKRAWADGDAVGLYAIETSTGTEKITNVKLTYSSSTGKWSLPANTTLLYTPKYEYYVYYPYQTAGLAHSATASAKQMTSRATTATSYFANGISSWTIPTDQTNVATLNSADLQTSKGTVSASDAATLNFTMESEMTLCKVTLGSKDIPFTRTYKGNTDTYTDSGSKTVKAANNFNGGGIKPYHSGTSDNYYAIVKPGKISTQQLKCAANIANGWAKAPVTPEGTRRNMWSHTVLSDSTVIFMARAYSYTGNVQALPIPVSGEYKLEVWGAQGTCLYAQTSHRQPFYGGKGGYAVGHISLLQNDILYVCVGQNGFIYDSIHDTELTGGYNIAREYGYNGGGCGHARGGGATHIALNSNRGEL